MANILYNTTINFPQTTTLQNRTEPCTYYTRQTVRCEEYCQIQINNYSTILQSYLTWIELTFKPNYNYPCWSNHWRHICFHYGMVLFIFVWDYLSPKQNPLEMNSLWLGRNRLFIYFEREKKRRLSLTRAYNKASLKSSYDTITGRYISFTCTKCSSTRHLQWINQCWCQNVRFWFIFIIFYLSRVKW